MQQRKPVLVMSDLSDGSIAALQFAGMLANVIGTELHVLHAMSLKRQALRAVVPALGNLNATLKARDEALRAQVRTHVPDVASMATLAIDLDDPVRALQLRAAQDEPMVAVIPNIWDWSISGRARTPSITSALANVSAPVLLIRERRREFYNRVLVISSPDSLESETIEAAGRWSFWLEQVYGVSAGRGSPEFDVLLLESEGKPNAILPRVVDNHVDLLVIDSGLCARPDVRPMLDAIMPMLLDRTVTPIAFLPRSVASSGPQRRLVATHPKDAA